MRVLPFQIFERNQTSVFVICEEAAYTSLGGPLETRIGSRPAPAEVVWPPTMDSPVNVLLLAVYSTGEVTALLPLLDLATCFGLAS